MVVLRSLLAGAAAVALIGAAPAPRAGWVGSWAAGQQIPEPRNALAAADLEDATLRQVVHLSIGGARIRVRLSNAFGTEPLRISSAHVARARAPGASAIVAGSDRALSFGGVAGVTIPAHADYWSDPVEVAVPAAADLTISLHLDHAPAGQTSHPGSRETTYLVHGDHTADLDLSGARTFEHWFDISGVDVASATATGSVVTLGDSITDGHGATTNGDDRWPDVLAARLRAARGARAPGVLNVGIGGNRILLDGLGPNALARFDRDVVVQSGVRAVIVLEGINDLGTLTRDAPVSPERHQALVHDLIAAYGQMIERAHAHGITVIGATITPDAGSANYHPDAANEADRQAVNAWIRAPGHFDGVADFDRAARDPAHPDRLAPAFDSGDHLHPSPAGYRAMAAAIPLDFLER